MQCMILEKQPEQVKSVEECSGSLMHLYKTCGSVYDLSNGDIFRLTFNTKLDGNYSQSCKLDLPQKTTCAILPERSVVQER